VGLKKPAGAPQIWAKKNPDFLGYKPPPPRVQRGFREFSPGKAFSGGAQGGRKKPALGKADLGARKESGLKGHPVGKPAAAEKTHKLQKKHLRKNQKGPIPRFFRGEGFQRMSEGFPRGANIFPQSMFGTGDHSALKGGGNHDCLSPQFLRGGRVPTMTGDKGSVRRLHPR